MSWRCIHLAAALLTSTVLVALTALLGLTAHYSPCTPRRQLLAEPGSNLSPPTNAVFLLANNPNNSLLANSTFGPSDIAILFNTATPLACPAVAALGRHQRVWMLRWNAAGQNYWGQAQLKSSAQLFSRVILLGGTRAQAAAQRRQLNALGVGSEWVVEEDLVPAYDTTGKRYPSSGFSAFYYARRHFPRRRIVLAGFTGVGCQACHNFEHERAVMQQEQGVSFLNPQ